MMTAGQFFLYLLIIIILKESLASAAEEDCKDLEMQTPSPSSCCCDGVSISSEVVQTEDGSSKENPGFTAHGFSADFQAAPSDSTFVRGIVDWLALKENFRKASALPVGEGREIANNVLKITGYNRQPTTDNRWAVVRRRLAPWINSWCSSKCFLQSMMRDSHITGYRPWPRVVRIRIFPVHRPPVSLLRS